MVFLSYLIFSLILNLFILCCSWLTISVTWPRPNTLPPRPFGFTRGLSRHSWQKDLMVTSSSAVRHISISRHFLHKGRRQPSHSMMACLSLQMPHNFMLVLFAPIIEPCTDFSEGNCECHATFHIALRHHDINILRGPMGIYPALLCL